ncbi:MAG: sigma-70 family RNA polymerase sigma factor [Planctomycetota bacterium]
MRPEEIAAALLTDQPSLTAYVATIVRDFHAAEDIFQEVCVKAVAASGTFTDTKHVLKWSRVTARNRSIDHLRKKRAQVGLSEELLDVLEVEWPSVGDGSGHERLESLRRCMERLTTKNREILRLRYFSSLSGKEVAQRIGRKVETVYQSLARIHKRLALCVSESSGIEAFGDRGTK